MAATTITSQFYASGGYERLPGKPSYVSEEDANAIIGGALTLFNRLAVQDVAVEEVEGELTASDYLVNQIIAEIACYLKDLDYARRQFDPDTEEGNTSNQHWRVAHYLMVQLYGVRDSSGKMTLPIHSDDGAACMTLEAVDSAY